MPGRKTPLVTEYFYHIYNRGIAEQPVFLDKRDYDQAMLAINYYRFDNLPIRLSRFKELALEKRNKILTELQNNQDVKVKIVCFVLMPNHFHFLLQQNTDSGIADFISKWTNSYTKYFNSKGNRSGPIFQGVFKSVLIEGNEQLLHLSRYIHINPIVSAIIKPQRLFEYSWSSLPEYLKENSNLIWVDPILGQFSNIEAYKQFLEGQIEYGKTLELIKHLTLER